MNRWLIGGAAATAVALVLVVLFVAPGRTQPGGKPDVSNAAERTVNATGTATAKLTANTAHVSVSLTASGADAAAALKALAAQKEKLVAALKKEGFDKVHDGFVSPVSAISQIDPMDPSKDAKQPRGDPGKTEKQATQMSLPLTVVVQKNGDFPGLIEGVNRVVAIAAAHGASPAPNPTYLGGGGFPVGGMGGAVGTFVILSGDENQGRKEALLLALHQANGNAKAMAGEMGVKLREVIAISEPPATANGWPMTMFGGVVQGGFMFDAVTGQKEITMTVSVTYSY